MIDDDRHPDAKIGPHRTTGAFVGVFPPDAAAERVEPIGEWNDGRVVVNGDHVEHWLNGASARSTRWRARKPKRRSPRASSRRSTTSTRPSMPASCCRIRQRGRFRSIRILPKNTRALAVAGSAVGHRDVVARSPRRCRSAAAARSSAPDRAASLPTARSSRPCAGWRTAPGTSRPGSPSPGRSGPSRSRRSDRACGVTKYSSCSAIRSSSSAMSSSGFLPVTVEHQVGDLLDDLGARVVRLVDAVAESHQPCPRPPSPA